MILVSFRLETRQKLFELCQNITIRSCILLILHEIYGIDIPQKKIYRRIYDNVYDVAVATTLPDSIVTEAKKRGLNVQHFVLEAIDKCYEIDCTKKYREMLTSGEKPNSDNFINI